MSNTTTSDTSGSDHHGSGPAEDSTEDSTEDHGDQQGVDLDALVGEWLDWAACGAALGVSVSKVRQLIREHQLAAAVPSPGAGQQVPAALVMDGAVVKGVPGVLIVLHDGLYDDREIIEWLFRDDPSLPGRPIDALRENRGSEVKRRAQAMAL